jgi:rhodanese-related sulfurtransferase
VPSNLGSSVDDLCRAVCDHGGHAVPLSGLGEAALRASPDPVILHVRRPGYRSEFAHWVLFLGCDGTTARILDPPGNAQPLPFAELLAMWDGVGIVVSSSPSAALQVRAGGWLALAATLTVLAAAVAGSRRLAPRFAARSWAGPAWLVTVSVTAALIYHASSASGFLRSPAATGEVARRYFQPDLPTVSTEEVAAFVGRPGVALIDCRLKAAYQNGHIPGAVNLSIAANTAERARILGDVPISNRLIVYCESVSCGWAQQMAGDLYYRGYRNVAVFRDGWVGWSRSESGRLANSR